MMMGTIVWSILCIAVAGAVGYAFGKMAVRTDRSIDTGQPVVAQVVDVPPLDEQLEAQRDAYLQELLDTVSHIRHDWLNDMQVLSGYIQLKKYDYLLPHMEKIRLKLQNEGSLAKLGVQSLVAYLLTFRTECRIFELELEFPQEVDLAQLPLEVDTVEQAVRSVLGSFRDHAQENMGEPNVLSLEFAREDDGLLLDFAYNGQYDEYPLRRELEIDLPEALPGIEIDGFEQHDGLVSLAIRVPYRESISET